MALSWRKAYDETRQVAIETGERWKVKALHTGNPDAPYTYVSEPTRRAAAGPNRR